MSVFRKLKTVFSGERKPGQSPVDRQLRAELMARAVRESADVIAEHLGTTLILNSSPEIKQFALSQAPATGLLIEFGVFKGTGINFFADQMTRAGDNRTIYGFDSFRGLSEHWAGTRHWKGRGFDLKGNLPQVRSNVQLVSGWIDDTLPPFLAANEGPIAFAHIDMDTYAPCKTILSLCRDRLAPGSVLLFDELLCYPGWRHGEYKALMEELDQERYEFRAVAGQRVMLVIK